MAALTAEQQAAAHAPLDEALIVLAAAGTGKTTTMLERVRFALQQGVPAEQVLVLTFSRRAQSEFAARLQQRVPDAEQATVSTFHAWAWQLVRRHWREAGFAQQPTVAAAEEQLESVMRDCLTWDGLEALRCNMAGWLWLPPTAPWAEVGAAAAERQAALHARCLAAAVSAFNHDTCGSAQALTVDAAAALPWDQLPPRVQLLLICELHDTLAARFRQRQRGGSCEGATAADLLAGAAKQAPAFLHWLDSQRRQGRAVDEQAYLAACAAAHAASEQSQSAGGGSRGGGGGRASADPERQRRLVRVGLAFQQAMRRLNLVALSDLPLLARQLLAAGGAAAAWARRRWSVVLVDEFQDTGRVLLDLLSLLLGDRRSVTAVGDDDQSIYSFLGTEPRIFQEFQARFAPCATRCLQLNFRSTPHICALGSSLLRGNRRAAEKSMQPARGSSGGNGGSSGSGSGGGFTPVIVQQHASPKAEAAALAAEVQRLWREEGVPHSSITVLFRCLRLQGGAPHAPLVAALRKCGIPFNIANHDRLGDDPAVAALCAYLALAADPGCDPAFEAVLSLPHHGLGAEVRSAVTQQRQAARLAGRPLPSLLDCAESVCSQAAAAAADLEQEQFGPTQLSQLAGQLSQLNREDQEELQRLVALLRRMRKAVGREPLPQAVLRVLQESGLVDWLRQQQLLEEGGAPTAPGKHGRVAEQLPPNLRAVLHKARQVLVDWQQAQLVQQAQQHAQQAQQHAQQQQQAQQQARGEQAAAAGAGASEQGSTEEGAALVKELLARLAIETKADDAAENGSQGSDQAGDAASTAGEAAPQQSATSLWWDQPQQQPPQQAEGPGVLTISTIHAAKGLEWPVVLIPFANEGHLPLAWRPPAALLADWQATGGVPERDVAEMRRAHYEEERRLFHVAATRARDRLLISYVQPAAAAAEPDAATMSLQDFATQLPVNLHALRLGGCSARPSSRSVDLCTCRFAPARLQRPDRSRARYRSTSTCQAALGQAPVAAAAAAAAGSAPMLLAAAAGAAALWAAWTLLRFARADADLTLLSKRAPPANAWRGKVVWIVGASQGLGEALARYWAEAGARLILSSRSLDKLEAVKRHCCQHVAEGDVVLLPLDLVGDSAGLEAAAKVAFAAFDGAGVDYVVHNAGASQHAAAEDTSPQVAAALLNLNLEGPLGLARATLPLMVAQGRGQHVVVASMSAVVPSPGQAVYAAGKAGLRAYFQSMASELSNRGVGATICCPGPLATGGDGKPRLVYGPKGLIQQAATGMSKKRVGTARAADLIARAAYHKLDECWIAYHPVLLLGYLMQYAPTLGMAVLKRVGPARAQALKEGRSGYDAAAIIKSASTASFPE